MNASVEHLLYLLTPKISAYVAGFPFSQLIRLPIGNLDGLGNSTSTINNQRSIIYRYFDHIDMPFAAKIKLLVEGMNPAINREEVLFFPKADYRIEDMDIETIKCLARRNILVDLPEFEKFTNKNYRLIFQNKVSFPEYEQFVTKYRSPTFNKFFFDKMFLTDLNKLKYRNVTIPTEHLRNEEIVNKLVDINFGILRNSILMDDYQFYKYSDSLTSKLLMENINILCKLLDVKTGIVKEAIANSKIRRTLDKKIRNIYGKICPTTYQIVSNLGLLDLYREHLLPNEFWYTNEQTKEQRLASYKNNRTKNLLHYFGEIKENYDISDDELAKEFPYLMYKIGVKPEYIISKYHAEALCSIITNKGYEDYKDYMPNLLEYMTKEEIKYECKGQVTDSHFADYYGKSIKSARSN